MTFHYGYKHFYTFWYFCKIFLFSYIVNLYFKLSKKSWWLFLNALRKNTLIYMLLLTAEYLMNLTAIKRLIKCFIFVCWIENIYHLELWENFFNLCMRVSVFIRMCLWVLLWYTLLVLMFYIFLFCYGDKQFNILKYRTIAQRKEILLFLFLKITLFFYHFQKTYILISYPHIVFVVKH